MKAKLLLADAAVNHPDGTFSLLRGGIERINVAPNKPPFLKAALIARIEATVGEKGKHSFRLVCIDEDGSSVLPDLEGNFEVPEKGGNTHLVLNIQGVFPRLGRYSFIIAVDGHELDRWDIQFVREEKRE